MQKITECLLIDDDQDDQEIFKMCIEKVSDSVNCMTMGDAPAAISMLKTNTEYTPQYIFLDVNMPKMNGVECLKLIRAIERFNASKIYMYSTTSVQSFVDETKRLGADDFIIKPFSTAALKETLSKIFAAVPEQTGK